MAAGNSLAEVEWRRGTRNPTPPVDLLAKFAEAWLGGASRLAACRLLGLKSAECFWSRLHAFQEAHLSFSELTALRTLDRDDVAATKLAMARHKDGCSRGGW
jgi:hypothetical protein